MNAKSLHGFTLTELLVVIAIIGVLAALLFSVFARSRDNGRRASCLSNERQLGIAFLQYEQESDERYPEGTVRQEDPDHPGEMHPTGEGWAGQVYSYVKNVGVFQCLDDPTPAIAAAQVVSYGYNTWLPESFDVKAMPGRVLSTTKTVLLFETTGNTAQITLADEGAAQGAREFSASGYGGILGCGPGGGSGKAVYATGWMGGDAPYKDDMGRFQFPDRDGRHAGGADYLLTDGHVKWFLPGEVLANNHPEVSNTQFDNYEAHFMNENWHHQK